MKCGFSVGSTSRRLDEDLIGKRVCDKSARAIPVAITIAGSDSGGGAGIQADIKTFAAMKVHGTTALTSVTAQNTSTVLAVQDIRPDIIQSQIDAIASDIGIDAGKTGMLHTKEIIEAVSAAITRQRFPLVVDPVMIAKSGAALLQPEAMGAMKERILPLATVVTPNRFEAEALANMKISSMDQAKTCAEKISHMGPEAVVIKGGHLDEEKAVDILYHKGEFKLFESRRFDVRTTHGTGCSFSAAIAAGLAKGEDIPEAVGNAKRFISLAIRFGVNVGKGHGPVNPMAHLYRESAKYNALADLAEAKALLESTSSTATLVPEVGMNVAVAIPYAETKDDIAAIEGRFTKMSKGIKAAGCPRFGCSSHLAKYILEVTKHDSSKRAAVNLKFSEETVKALEDQGLVVSFYNRQEEPEHIKRVEGMSVPWGIKQAILRVGKVPDVVYHRGDVGKEPMIVLLGKRATDLARLVVGLS